MQPDQPPRREPVFNAPTIVMAVIALLVMVQALRSSVDYQTDAELIVMLAFIPIRLTEAGASLPGGALFGWTSTFTHAFLHADWMHLTINGAWLLAFGSLIARRCGWFRFLLLYAASAVAGALFFFVINADQAVPLVGASGAISGLMGAAFRILFSGMEIGGLSMVREHPNEVPRMPLSVALTDRPTLSAVAIWIGVNLVFGLGFLDFLDSGQIAWEAHLGGFLFGFLCFRPFDLGPGYKEFRAKYGGPNADPGI